MMRNWNLNERAAQLCGDFDRLASSLGVQLHEVSGGGRLYDCGINATGSLQAGQRLAEICLAGLGQVTITPGELRGLRWPTVQVVTDQPVAACLASQYAGWQLSAGKFFAMGSGPMRAAAARELLFEKLGYRERAERVVGVLEGRKLPTEEVWASIAEKTGVPADRVTLLIAPTASLAGTFQVVARSIETALHKLFELGFDVGRIRHAWGAAPLAPVAGDDLTAVGWTNDAILYGASVTLWVEGDDESLAAIGPQVPSSSAPGFGAPFLTIFEAAGRDFYKIDPHLFSPAQIVFQNVRTGRVQAFGELYPEVLVKSWGL